MKNKKYKYFVLYLSFVFIMFFSLYYLLNDKNNYNMITKNIKNISASVSKIIYYPIYHDDNNDFVINKENKILRKEISEYKKELQLNETLADRKLINANIIKRSTSYFYNIITINKGLKSGIKNGNIVINNDGVIGIVIKSNNNSSDVKLLTSKNKNNYISVMFKYKDNYYYGLIDNYNIKKNELHLKNVIGDFSNLEGIEVLTSGLNNNESKGFLVGKIKSFNKEEYGISNNIYVTPSVDFNYLSVVTVVVR